MACLGHGRPHGRRPRLLAMRCVRRARCRDDALPAGRHRCRLGGRPEATQDGRGVDRGARVDVAGHRRLPGALDARDALRGGRRPGRQADPGAQPSGCRRFASSATTPTTVASCPRRSASTVWRRSTSGAPTEAVGLPDPIRLVAIDEERATPPNGHAAERSLSAFARDAGGFGQPPAIVSALPSGSNSAGRVSASQADCPAATAPSSAASSGACARFASFDSPKARPCAR